MIFCFVCQVRVVAPLFCLILKNLLFSKSFVHVIYSESFVYGCKGMQLHDFYFFLYTVTNPSYILYIINTLKYMYICISSRVALRDKYISAIWNYVWTCSLCSGVLSNFNFNPNFLKLLREKVGGQRLLLFFTPWSVQSLYCIMTCCQKKKRKDFEMLSGSWLSVL